MSVISVQSWVSNAGSHDDHRSVQAQNIIKILESLFLRNITPRHAARVVNEELLPLIKANPAEPRIGSIWAVVCHAARELGSDRSISVLLVQFLDALQTIEVKDDDGGDIRKDWGGYFWKDLPGFALTFREYGINLEPDEGLTDREWLAQRTHFQNATEFASTALATSSQFSGFVFFFLDCMGNAFGGAGDELSPSIRAAMYLPAISAWLTNAGDQIYRLSNEGTGKGIDVEKWSSWKTSLDKLAAESSVEEHLRTLATEAKRTMDSIEARIVD